MLCQEKLKWAFSKLFRHVHFNFCRFSLRTVFQGTMGLKTSNFKFHLLEIIAFNESQLSY